MSKRECKECLHYDVCDKQKITNHTISKSVCKHYKNKSLFVEKPCEWGKDVYTIVKGCKNPLKTKLFAVGVTDEGDITYNPSEYPKGVFSIYGVILGENTFPTKKEAEAKLKETEE